MFDEEYMRLDTCVECDKEINLEEKRVLIYQDEFGKHWVHAGKCLESYKKLLIGLEAVEQGMILGMCFICAKPVREKQRYLLGRTGQSDCASKTENPFYTTFPSGENKQFLTFMHEECEKSAD